MLLDTNWLYTIKAAARYPSLIELVIIGTLVRPMIHRSSIKYFYFYNFGIHNQWRKLTWDYDQRKVCLASLCIILNISWGFSGYIKEFAFLSSRASEEWGLDLYAYLLIKSIRYSTLQEEQNYRLSMSLQGERFLQLSKRLCGWWKYLINIWG